MASEKFHGIFKGTVVNNIDTETRGRLLVEVPDVLTLVPSSWAEPCTALAGPTGTQMGAYLVPPIGAGVWIAFQQGDPDYPVWMGCRWGAPADVPAIALLGVPATPNIVFQTALQNTLVISDLAGPTGGIMLKSTTGASIIVNDTGIYIQNGKGASIVMTGPTVLVNQGALSIT